jgi:DNA-binding Lrp family transcriptional regulator
MELRKEDKKILHRLQSNFPLTPLPFKTLAEELGLEEHEVLQRTRVMVEKGIVRRLGPIIDTHEMGNTASLMAMKVPEERIEEVSKVINAYTKVSHNYLRKGKNKEIPYNVWFTMSATNKQDLDRTIKEIEEKTGLDVRNLPTTKKFKIGVKFNIYKEDKK